MSTLKLKGSTSGYVELTAPATAGDNTITLPTTAGTVAVKDVSNNVEVGTGVTIGSPSSNVFTVSTNGSERVRVTSTGSVGIGTDTPNQKLTMVGGGIQLDSGWNTQWGGNSDRAYIQGTSGGSGYLLLGTNNAERLRVLAAGGLTFNGDTAAANALDDYEEGTWTPNANGGSSYSNQVGYYVKIGSMVFVSWSSTFTSSNPGGGAFITGLPFSSLMQNGKQSASTFGRNTYTTDNCPTGIVQFNAVIYPITLSSGNSPNPKVGGAEIMLSAVYYVG